MKNSLEIKYERLAKYVMESKQFERKIFYAVAGLYVFIICHIIGFVIGKSKSTKVSHCRSVDKLIVVDM